MYPFKEVASSSVVKLLPVLYQIRSNFPQKLFNIYASVPLILAFFSLASNTYPEVVTALLCVIFELGTAAAAKLLTATSLS